MRKIRLNRDVTKEECPWLNKDMKAGTMVYEYTGCHYGVISFGGMAVSDQLNQTPFYELPGDAVSFVQ